MYYIVVSCVDSYLEISGLGAQWSWIQDVEDLIQKYSTFGSSSLITPVVMKPTCNRENNLDHVDWNHSSRRRIGKIRIHKKTTKTNTPKKTCQKGSRVELRIVLGDMSMSTSIYRYFWNINNIDVFWRKQRWFFDIF